MPKAYWISAYRSIHDPEALAAYAKLAGPALNGAGGKFLARGTPAQTYEAGLNQRLVIIEFPDMATLRAWYHSPEYAKLIELRQGVSRGSLVAVEGA